MSITDAHLVNILYKYYLDREPDLLYYRWETYLLTKNYVREYVAMTYKSNDQQQRILAAAEKKAKKVTDSQLYKAMR